MCSTDNGSQANVIFSALNEAALPPTSISDPQLANSRVIFHGDGVLKPASAVSSFAAASSAIAGFGISKRISGMRSLRSLTTLLCFCFCSVAAAQTSMPNAGISRITVDSQVSFDTLVWYPTQAHEASWQIGLFTIPANHNATVAPGQFPVILLSHGGGQTGGSPLLLSNLSARLAREGFIVVAPFHGKTRFLQRPRQVEAALEAVRADPRFKSHIASDKVGMLGFSLGGAVTLALAGGIPNFQHLAAYCAIHSDDTQSCNDGPGGNINAGSPTQTQPPPNGFTIPRLPLKGLVLLDPFAVPFQGNDLNSVSMPVLVFRPKQS